jgi:ribonuclease HI
MSLEEKERSFSYRLEFECTNNIAEYKFVCIGLELALDMGIKCLQVMSDSDLIILQVKRQFSAKNERFKRYRNAVWDSIDLFEAFDIRVVPREQNANADLWCLDNPSTCHLVWILG